MCSIIGKRIVINFLIWYISYPTNTKFDNTIIIWILIIQQGCLLFC